jgi:hypothetical protein
VIGQVACYRDVAVAVIVDLIEPVIVAVHLNVNDTVRVIDTVDGIATLRQRARSRSR